MKTAGWDDHAGCRLEAARAGNRDQLILDWSPGGLFALVSKTDGTSVPITLQVHERHSRYFPAYFLFDPDAYAKETETTLKRINKALSQVPGLSRISGRSMGWIRPWEQPVGQKVERMPDPLVILSTHGIMEELESWEDLLPVFSALAAGILGPVIRSMKRQDLSPSEMDVIFLRSPYLGRLAHIVVYKVLKAFDFRRVCMADRAAASVAARALGGKGAQRVLVLDGDDSRLLMSDVRVEKREETIRSRVEKSAWAAGLGQTGMVQGLCKGLLGKKMISDKEKMNRLLVSQALSGMAGGVFSNQLPEGGRLTMALMDNLLEEGWGEGLRDTLEKEALPFLAGDKEAYDAIVTYGGFFLHGKLEKLFIDTLGIPPCRQSGKRLPKERAAYGVHDSLNQLRQGGADVLSLGARNGIRISSMRGESLELVAPSAIPNNVGGRNTVRQVLDLGAADGSGDVMMVLDVLWGTNSDPELNSSLCCITMDTTRSELEAGASVQMDFHLERGVSGLQGSMNLSLGEKALNQKLFFPSFS